MIARAVVMVEAFKKPLPMGERATRLEAQPLATVGEGRKETTLAYSPLTKKGLVPLSFAPRNKAFYPLPHRERRRRKFFIFLGD